MINYDLPSKEIADYHIRGQNEPLDLVKFINYKLGLRVKAQILKESYKHHA